MNDQITLHELGPDDLDHLTSVEEGLFDNPIDPVQAAAFLADPGHAMVLASIGAKVVGMASGQVMLHPDKQPAFFVNEVGVRETHRQRGIGRRLCRALIAIAEAKGCSVVWLATEMENDAARALYRSLNAQETQGVVVYDWGGVMDD